MIKIADNFHAFLRIHRPGVFGKAGATSSTDSWVAQEARRGRQENFQKLVNKYNPRGTPEGTAATQPASWDRGASRRAGEYAEHRSRGSDIPPSIPPGPPTAYQGVDMTHLNVASPESLSRSGAFGRGAAPPAPAPAKIAPSAAPSSMGVTPAAASISAAPAAASAPVEGTGEGLLGLLRRSQGLEPRTAANTPIEFGDPAAMAAAAVPSFKPFTVDGIKFTSQDQWDSHLNSLSLARHGAPRSTENWGNPPRRVATPEQDARSAQPRAEARQRAEAKKEKIRAALAAKRTARTNRAGSMFKLSDNLAKFVEATAEETAPDSAEKPLDLAAAYPTRSARDLAARAYPPEVLGRMENTAISTQRELVPGINDGKLPWTSVTPGDMSAGWRNWVKDYESPAYRTQFPIVSQSGTPLATVVGPNAGFDFITNGGIFTTIRAQGPGFNVFGLSPQEQAKQMVFVLPEEHPDYRRLNEFKRRMDYSGSLLDRLTEGAKSRLLPDDSLSHLKGIYRSRAPTIDADIGVGLHEGIHALPYTADRGHVGSRTPTQDKIDVGLTGISRGEDQGIGGVEKIRAALDTPVTLSTHGLSREEFPSFLSEMKHIFYKVTGIEPIFDTPEKLKAFNEYWEKLLQAHPEYQDRYGDVMTVLNRLGAAWESRFLNSVVENTDNKPYSQYNMDAAAFS